MFKTILTLIGPKRRNQMLALIQALLLTSVLEVAGIAIVKLLRTHSRLEHIP